MGGNSEAIGNCSPVAEYNYWCDPDAAAICYDLFGKAGKKIEMVGLDVTRKIVLTPNILEYVCRLDPENGEFIRRITGFYMDFHWEYEKIIGCVINDPLAVAYYIDRSLCGGFDSYTAVATDGICRGQTVVDSMDFWKKEPQQPCADRNRYRKIYEVLLFQSAEKAGRKQWEAEELTLLSCL